jgi:AbrB family transcriptional regulator (stage V sporulation protein T)
MIFAKLYGIREERIMKVTGIVRKLDTLGRIVIPREYRKMHKIKESDPLEIIALENGDIVIRKVDVSAELLNAGKPIVDEVYRTMELGIMLSDGERYIAGAGALRNQLIGTELSRKAKDAIENRKCYSGKSAGVDLAGAEYVSICPVFGEDVFGAVILFTDAVPASVDGRILQLMGKILGNCVQRF